MKNEFLFFVYGIVLLLVVLIFLVAKTDIHCVNKGGVPTRIGCVKPEIFVK